MKHLICPLCSQPLSSNEQGVNCQNRHQYDRAKEGYLNLLPVQYKNSIEPGDAKQQLQARRAFLQAGYFAPLLHTLLQSISVDSQSVLDIGCGEGYFTRGISASLPEASIYGLDIAKAAIRLASRKTPSAGNDQLVAPAANNLTYMVASSHSLPVANSSMDIVTRIYAPSKDEELQRILKPEGTLIIITPGENHLLALRQYIYQELRPHPKPRAPAGFVELSQQRLSFALDIPAGEFTRALLQMTPFAWRFKPAVFEQIIVNGLQDTADFQVSSYRLA